VLISRKRHKLRHSYNVQLIHVRDTYDALWYAENPISPLVVIHFSPLIWVIAVNTGFRHCAAHDDCLHSKIVCTQRTRDLLRQLWTERGSDESRDTCVWFRDSFVCVSVLFQVLTHCMSIIHYVVLSCLCFVNALLLVFFVHCLLCCALSWRWLVTSYYLLIYCWVTRCCVSWHW